MEGRRVVGESEDWLGDEELLELFKTVLLFGGPVEFFFFLDEAGEWFGKFGKTIYVFAEKGAHSNKTSDSTDGGGDREILDCFEVAIIGSVTILTNDVAKKFNFLDGEETFLGGEFEIIEAETFEDLLEVLEMLFVSSTGMD